VHESNHLVEPLIPMMILLRRKKILLFLIPFGIFFILSFAYFYLDKYVEAEIFKFDEEKEVNLKSFELDHLNPDAIYLEVGIKIAKVSKPQWWKYFFSDKPLRSEMNQINLESEVGWVSADRINLLHSWEDLDLELKALSVDGLKLHVNGMKLNSLLSSEDPKNLDVNQTNSSIDFLRDSLNFPPVKHMRFRKSEFSASWGEKIMKFDFNASAKLIQDFSNIQLDGSLEGMPVTSDLTLAQDGEVLHVTSKLEFSDFSKSRVILEEIKDLAFTSDRDLAFDSGSLVVRKSGTLHREERSDQRQLLDSLFVEMNGSDLRWEWGNKFGEIKKFMAFLSGFSGGEPESINAYANFNWNDQFEGVGARAQRRFLKTKDGENQKLAISASVWELNGSKALPFKVKNLSVPFFEIEHNASIEEALRKEHEIKFNQITWNLDELKLETGAVILKALDGLSKWKVKIPPLVAHMPSRQLTFSGFSYEGILDVEKFPQVQEIQNVRMEELLLGDDFRIENILVSFCLNREKELEIKKLELSLDNFHVSMNPANLFLGSSVDSESKATFFVDFKGSNLSMQKDNYKIEVQNIHGGVQLDSLDPFETEANQKLAFEQIQFGDLEFKEGNLSFAIRNGSDIEVEKLSMNGFGGLVGLGVSTYSLDPIISRLLLDFDQVSGQKLANLFKDLDLRIDGNFSGEIPIAPSQDNLWDFVGGFLKLIEGGVGYYSWDANGLLTDTMDENDLLYGQTKLAEEALKQLEVDSMKLNFIVLDGKREIIGDIRGKAEVEGKTVNLKYKPRIVGNLQEILDAIDLLKLQVNQ
jgi:hypothetical protein